MLPTRHMKHPTFHLDLYVRGIFYDTIVMDCRQDFEEVATYARAVRERGIQERRPITMDMLPDPKSTLLAAVFPSRPRPSGMKMECMPRTFAMFEPCDMTLMQWPLFVAAYCWATPYGWTRIDSKLPRPSMLQQTFLAQAYAYCYRLWFYIWCSQWALVDTCSIVCSVFGKIRDRWILKGIQLLQLLKPRARPSLWVEWKKLLLTIKRRSYLHTKSCYFVA